MTRGYGMFFGILACFAIGLMGCSALRMQEEAPSCEDQVQFQNPEHCAEDPEGKSECVFAYLFVTEVCAKAPAVKALAIVFPQKDDEQNYVVVLGQSVNRAFRLRVTITPDWDGERIAAEVRPLVRRLEQKLEQPLVPKTSKQWDI